LKTGSPHCSHNTQHHDMRVAAALAFLATAVVGSTLVAGQVSGVEVAPLRKQTTTKPPAPPVAVVLYYESLCFDCIDWITTRLAPAVRAQGVLAILNMTLVPFGNAQEQQSGSGWVFTCQHGPRECLGNTIETCAYGLDNWDFVKVWPFIYCVESSHDPVANAEACANKTGKDWPAINNCAQGVQGNTWQHQMAVKTAALDPPHTHVPWVTINGQHSPDAEGDFLTALCNAYTGPPPAGCQRLSTIV